MTNGEYQRILKAKENEIENLRSALRLVEWISVTPYDPVRSQYCFNCGREKWQGHHIACAIGDAIRRKINPYKAPGSEIVMEGEGIEKNEENTP